MRQMTIKRTGTFMVAVTGPNHCGTHDHHEKLRYTVEAQCRSEFNERGFLFDQLEVDNYFQTIKETTLSCEQLTQKVCADILALIERENTKCPVINLKVSLSPDPFAAEMVTTMEHSEIQEHLNKAV